MNEFKKITPTAFLTIGLLTVSSCGKDISKPALPLLTTSKRSGTFFTAQEISCIDYLGDEPSDLVRKITPNLPHSEIPKALTFLLADGRKNPLYKDLQYKLNEDEIYKQTQHLLKNGFEVSNYFYKFKKNEMTLNLYFKKDSSSKILNIFKTNLTTDERKKHIAYLKSNPITEGADERICPNGSIVAFIFKKEKNPYVIAELQAASLTAQPIDKSTSFKKETNPHMFIDSEAINGAPQLTDKLDTYVMKFSHRTPPSVQKPKSTRTSTYPLEPHFRARSQSAESKTATLASQKQTNKQIPTSASAFSILTVPAERTPSKSDGSLHQNKK